MIRSAVRTHFASTDISSDLATSYFDKLIQVPLRIPHLGVNEIKCYLVLLLAEKQFKKDKISISALTAGENAVLELVKQSWLHGLTKKNLEDAFKGCIENMRPEIELADQIAPFL
jgi:predicted KAP-like P-loop ATPase